MKDTKKSAKSTTANDKTFEGFTDEERGAMKERAEVQHEVRDPRLQRRGEPRRRRHVADRLRSDEVDRRRRGKDRRAREESGKLRTEQATGPALVRLAAVPLHRGRAGIAMTA